MGFCTFVYGVALAFRALFSRFAIDKAFLSDPPCLPPDLADLLLHSKLVTMARLSLWLGSDPHRDSGFYREGLVLHQEEVLISYLSGCEGFASLARSALMEAGSQQLALHRSPSPHHEMLALLARLLAFPVLGSTSASQVE